jgi:hypothetical protein
MRVEDFFVQGRRGWVRLHEKGGKLHEMPTHHNLDKYLEAYITAAAIGDERKEPLFRTTRARTGELTDHAMLQSDVWRMIRRRAEAAGIKTEIGCHTFRATGITAYLKNGGKLEIAQQMANHESAPSSCPLSAFDHEVDRGLADAGQTIPRDLGLEVSTDLQAIADQSLYYNSGRCARLHVGSTGSFVRGALLQSSRASGSIILHRVAA